MVLVGVQPVLMQVPPRCSCSISATAKPRSASFCDSGFPAWPEPITMASKRGMVATPFFLSLGFSIAGEVAEMHNAGRPQRRPGAPLRCLGGEPALFVGADGKSATRRLCRLIDGATNVPRLRVHFVAFRSAK